MNLKVLTDTINAYSDSLSEADMYEWNELQAAQFRYSQNWNLEAKNLSSMTRACFRRPLSFWSRPDYYPLQAMIEYAESNDDMVRAMFSDLFNESRNLTDRVNRFLDQCDELRRVQKLNKVDVSPHWHDKEIIVLYLSFQYPEKYPLLFELGFRKLLTLLKAKPLEAVLDLDRYVKTSQIIYKLMNKNEKFKSKISEFDTSSDQEIIPNIQVVTHYYSWIFHEESGTNG